VILLSIYNYTLFLETKFYSFKSVILENPRSSRIDTIRNNQARLGFNLQLNCVQFLFQSDVTSTQNYFMFLKEPSDLSPKDSFHLQLQHVNGQVPLFQDTEENRAYFAKYTTGCTTLNYTDPVSTADNEIDNTGPDMTKEPNIIPGEARSSHIGMDENEPTIPTLGGSSEHDAKSNNSPLNSYTDKLNAFKATTTPSSGRIETSNLSLLLFLLICALLIE